MLLPKTPAVSDAVSAVLAAFLVVLAAFAVALAEFSVLELDWAAGATFENKFTRDLIMRLIFYFSFS
jgi:hypothetical protein